MKRFFTLLLTLTLVFALVVPAVFADVIWEPYENTFYMRHSNECSYHNRGYLVNSPEGGVRVYDAPNGRKENGTILNGETVHIYYIWKEWGYHSGWGEDMPEGWVKMEHLSLLYDKDSFANEFGDEFYSDEEAVQAFRDQLDPEAVLQIYQYPGSGVITSTLPVNWMDNPEDIGFRQLYKDESGLVWGNLGYFMGPRDWVCLSDPTNPELPKTGDHAIELYPAAPLAPNSGLATPTIAGLLVAAVAAVSVILLKRKRR